MDLPRCSVPGWRRLVRRAVSPLGGGQTISYDVTDAERGNSAGSPAELDFTVAALGAGMAGIRADAEVVANGATCSYSGGPGPARPRGKRDLQRH